MSEQRLFLLLSVASDDGWKFFESWDEDWDYLLDYGLIDMEDDDSIPTLTEKGKQALILAVNASQP